MKRIFLAALILLIASSAFAGLGDGLKKTLICVPNDRQYTGGIQLQLAGAIVQGGGTYEVMNYGAPADTTGFSASLSTRLRAQVATGRFGLIVVICRDSDYLYQNLATHGWGRMAKHCSIEQYPLGVPTIVLAQNRLERGAYTGCGTFRCGSAAGSDWVYAGAYDSLDCMTAESAQVLWNNGDYSVRQRKHTLDINQTPESSYPWTIDYWPKTASATHTGQGGTMYMWHVHRTAYDAAELPGAGQDSVIYYFPEWELAPNASYDKIKALSALLKKYKCINYHPWSIYIDDWGYPINGHLAMGAESDSTDVHLALRADTLMDWLMANQIPAQFNVQYARGDATQWPSNMAGHYSSPYIAYGWHPSNIYRTATRTSYMTTSDWPSALDGKTDSLYHVLKRDWTWLTSDGWDQYMELKTDCRPGGDFSGTTGYQRQDSVLAVYAACGVTQVRCEGSSFAGYTGSADNIFYPYRNYPINLVATGPNETGWRYLDMLYVNYMLLSWAAQSDSAYASPSLMHDSLIVRGIPLSNDLFYHYFSQVLLSNRRAKDRSGIWDGDVPAQWGSVFNGECRGFVFADHQYGTAVRNGTIWYNSTLLWLQHYWNNLDAYNDMARDDDPATGDTFKCMFLHEQAQRTNDRM